MGTEFAVLLEDVQNLKGAVRVADRMTGALETPFYIAGREAFGALSIGVAVGARGSESFLRRASAQCGPRPARGEEQ